jgi:uncharacterized protein YndB with AHSA1/START domain
MQEEVMEKLHFSIDIEAPKEKVWDTMLGEDTYRQWTDVFMEGSHYKGDWNEGSKILFLAPNESGKMEGMVSRIKKNREYEFVSVEHLGVVQDGNEDTSSDEVKKWAGALENYTFTEEDGKTTVNVDMDTEEENEEMFSKMWPNALQKLKELAENTI